MTPEGLEKNLDVGLRMDQQGHIPLQTIYVHLSNQGIYADTSQISHVGYLFTQILRNIPNVSFSEDTGKVFVNIPSKKSLVLISGTQPQKAADLKKHLELSGIQLTTEQFKDRE